MENEITVRQAEMAEPLTALAIRAQVQLIQEVMREVMQGPSKENPNGVHYGLIPGCGDKPSLFKPGAEKLFLTFRLRPIIDPALDVVITELAGGHRDYRVHCHILNMAGVEMATGVGSASTLESKHRYRGGKKKCPKCGAEAIIKGREEYGGGWICFAKKGGCGTKFADNAEEITSQADGKVENPDIADQYNTVLKMACKRAKVDGCLSSTACSDIFTQDISEEDMQDEHIQKPVKEKPHAPQRKSQAATEAKPPAKPTAGALTATGFISTINPVNVGGYKTYEMENQQTEEGWNKRFATKDADIIQTIEDLHGNGEKVALEYVEVPWSKGGKTGVNYSITGLIAVPEEAKVD